VIKHSLVDTAGPPAILGTGGGFLGCAVARTLNRLCADPLPNNPAARILRRWGAGTWPWEQLSWGEFITYGTGLGTAVGIFWWLL
jgi:hypothetical protein